MSSPATALTGLLQQPALEAPSPSEAQSQTHLQEQIAQLAYTLWQQRGCPEGSAELDWIEAEARLLPNRLQAGSGRR